MCGIFGYVGNPDRADAIDLDVAIEALRHRGPDGDGKFRARKGDVAVAMAHTRLAIIDLSPLAKQPMTTEDGRYTLTYNGEVYNFREIRRELESLGHSFRSHSDSEVVLKSYVEWGKRCVEHFRGMFVFAIWDETEGALFIARDRFGIKPFYYRDAQDGFAFSSEVRALLKTGLADRTLSREGLETYFTWGSVADPWTLIDGVHSLVPAHRGFWKNGKLEVERYWDFPEGGTRDISFEEAVEEIRPILRESIAKELVSDVPLGVFLSGGIDSSAIVAIASEVSDRPIHTFTLTFDEAKYNEAQYAREVAEKFGCIHTEVHLTKEKALGELDAAMASYDQPSADGINTWFVAKAAKEAGLSVALSGLGGDEIFAGYPNFLKFGRLVALSRLARPFGNLVAPFFGGASMNGTSMRTKKVGEVLRAEGDPLRVYAGLRCMFTGGQVETLMKEFESRSSRVGDRGWGGSSTGATPSNPKFDSRSSKCPVALYSQLELTNYLRNTLLRDSDQMSMAHGLEVRVPLLDHLVVEKVLPFAASLKIRNPKSEMRNVNKPLLAAAAGPLPRAVTHRAK
ncbi:MAG: asparagine synthase (glutamine-hydrolyzing), partial [Thermoanaerobaculia bacterium]